jgi:hypothetical protein
MSNQSPLEVMQKVFKEQHQQMITEQKRLLDGYKKYFDGMLLHMEAQVNAMNPPPEPPPPTEEEKVIKEIEEIRLLLDEAVKTHGKELADILTELAARQKRRVEAPILEGSVKD